MIPLKNVIEQIHQVFAKICWGNIGGIKDKQWIAWDEMCYPRSEGGRGLRSLHDIFKALVAKLWWNFRTSTSSLWAKFMWNKYCKKLHPTIVSFNGASHV